jgi:hypothetical protein
VFRPERVCDVAEMIAQGPRKPVIARGSGTAYRDATGRRIACARLDEVQTRVHISELRQPRTFVALWSESVSVDFGTLPYDFLLVVRPP